MSTDTNAAKPPLTLADLTEEQAIQIAKLAFGAADYIDVWGETAFAMGHAFVLFQSKGETFRVDISPERDIKMRKKVKATNASWWDTCDVHNQRAIQKLFTEWGAE